MNKKFLLLASVLVLTIVLASCSTQATPVSPQPSAYPIVDNSSAKTPAAGNITEISLVNFSFSPKEVTIKKGTTVTWTNQDSAVHTVTSDTLLFDSGDLAKGKSFSYTFSTAGTFAYHCTPHHASMTGTIVVTD